MATGGEITVVFDEGRHIDWSSRWLILPEHEEPVLTQELLHSMYYNLIVNTSTSGSINRPSPRWKREEEKKPEIKRGNPWVQ